MKTEYYKKVFIKTEADLPKERSEYIFGWDKTEINVNSGISKFIFYPNEPEIVKETTEDYDWYLQPIESQMPSDEEIEKESKIFWSDSLPYTNQAWKEGAKWMRDKSKLSDREQLREELLKFNSWMCQNQYDGRIPLIETCIDEYLKTL